MPEPLLIDVSDGDGGLAPSAMLKRVEPPKHRGLTDGPPPALEGHLPGTLDVVPGLRHTAGIDLHNLVLLGILLLSAQCVQSFPLHHWIPGTRQSMAFDCTSAHVNGSDCLINSEFIDSSISI